MVKNGEVTIIMPKKYDWYKLLDKSWYVTKIVFGLAIICLLPEFLIANYPIPFYLGGTALLIVVVVGMDTITQIQTRLMSVQYESLIKKTKFSR